MQLCNVVINEIFCFIYLFIFFLDKISSKLKGRNGKYIKESARYTSY